MDRVEGDRLHLDLYTEAAKRLGYPPRDEPPDDDPEGDTLRDELAAHNAATAETLAFQQVVHDFIRRTSLGWMVKCVGVAIQAEEDERKAFNDRR